MSELVLPVLENIPDNRLPLPDEISYYELEKERRYFLDYPVDDSCMELERMIIRWNMEDRAKSPEDRKPIWIYILSIGGYAHYMWSLIDTILLSETPVYTVNLGLAASAAGLIFMAGKKRFMLPRAKVMIHEGSASFEGDAGKVLDFSDAYKKDLKLTREYILEHTGIPKSQLAKKRSNDWELDSQTCLDYHVCDTVIHSLNEVIV